MEDRLAPTSNGSFISHEAGTFGACLFLLWLVPTMALWAFAFLSMPAASQDWLLRAQAACFGTDSSGLPSAQGWTILVLAPLSLLIAILVAFESDLRSGLANLWSSTPRRLGMSLLLLATIGECFWITTRISDGLMILRTSYAPSSTDSLPENYPRGNEVAPAFELLDQNGELQALNTNMQAPVILSFAFAHCTTVCPAVVQEVNQAARMLGPDRARALLVTLDPWRDTPSTLGNLAKTWNLAPNAHVLSGDVNKVQRVLDHFIPRARDEKNGDVTHPPLVLVISKHGQIVYSFNNPPRTWLVEAIKRVS
ncbi:MAG: SCO family protein [Oligoflexia bacterium]|nr:SCO family protein [Oligoflexia bacterium]